LNELSKVIKEIIPSINSIGPSIIASETRKEAQKKLAEERDKNNPQKRATRGY